MHKSPEKLKYGGWCKPCEKAHEIGADAATLEQANDLMRNLTEFRRVDFISSSDQSNPRFRTDYLFGPARGQMFGILTGRDSSGTLQVLRAFSGQYNGCWTVPDWAPPLFDTHRFDALALPGDARIKKLGRQIQSLPSDDPKHKALIRERRAFSRQLMKELHALYILHNFRHETAALTDFFPAHRGIPTGAGDCCAPKLLNQAARLGIRPTGLAEFYWGRENASGTRHHGEFYSSCPEKCFPILGFLLCGAFE